MHTDLRVKVGKALERFTAHIGYLRLHKRTGHMVDILKGTNQNAAFRKDGKDQSERSIWGGGGAKDGIDLSKRPLSVSRLT